MIPKWFPDHPPIYDIHKTYTENAEQGPFFNGPIPKREKPKQPLDFLGYEVNSPIGVPAGPLLNSRWIALAAKLGFDIPTYKTIRSYAHPSHPLPNVLFVKSEKGDQVIVSDETPDDIAKISITNSFGNPSKSPDFLLEDIAKANDSLQKGQVMIVSVFGVPNQGVSYADDFARAASLAKEGGAKVIEANFSCPNIGKGEGSLYMSADTVYEFVKKMTAAIGSTPLLIKVGIFKDAKQMESVFLAAARAGARGVCGINTISKEILDRNGKPALGENRRTGGICGSMARSQALHFIEQASRINRQHKLEFTLLGCGGITLPEHFDLFFHAGAQFALTATGMMWDPYLALRYHQTRSLHDYSLSRS